jgi:hypothetical protein
MAREAIKVPARWQGIERSFNKERGKHPTQGFAVDTCLGQESAGASKNR